MNNPSEFYVGYLPIPPALKKFARRVAISLGCIVAASATVLVIAQNPFAPSVFEFGDRRDFEGVLVAKPYPSLLAHDGLPWLLVGAGKHGVALPATLDGKVVHLRGERIYRGADRMIEVQAGSFAERGAGSVPAETDLGPAELTGEIVDSKC